MPSHVLLVNFNLPTLALFQLERFHTETPLIFPSILMHNFLLLSGSTCLFPNSQLRLNLIFSLFHNYRAWNNHFPWLYQRALALAIHLLSGGLFGQESRNSHFSLYTSAFFDGTECCKPLFRVYSALHSCLDGHQHTPEWCRIVAGVCWCVRAPQSSSCIYNIVLRRRTGWLITPTVH